MEIEFENLKKEHSYLFEHSQVGVIYLDENGTFMKANKKFCDTLGYSLDELLKLNFSDITYKDDKDKSIDYYKKTQKNEKESYNLEKRYVRKDGKILWVEIFINHIKDENQNLLYSLGFINDISKRKAIQDTIFEQTKTMQLYLDIVDVAIIVVNNQGNITLVNRKACEILDLEEHLVLGKNWFKNFVAEDDRYNEIQDFQDAILYKRDISEKIQYKIVCANNMSRTMLWRRKYIYDDKKRINGMISSGEDVTELLKLEEDKKKNEEFLFNQAKIASMGEMLRNIAHQWRQPLSTISTAASGIKIQKEVGILSDENFNLGMDSIVDMTQYLSQTINEFQSFFKIDTQISEFSNKELFKKVENFILTSFKSLDIKLEIDASETFIIRGSFNEIIKIIITMLNNAKDAFIGKGLDKKIVYLESDLKKDFFSISIKDNAGGIDEKIKEKIFEPYFTTKHQNLGTGIGLFMVKDVVENRFKGKIEAYNEKVPYEDTNRIGAIFKITLPLKMG